MTGGPGGRLGAWTGRYRGFEPDARRFLLVTLVGGAATSLWWIDFNLYLSALGFSESRIGVTATAGSIASALAAFPASSWSDRIGRRLVMVAGAAAGILAVVGMVTTADPTAILILAALYGAGNQAVQVVAVPYMSEHSDPSHRNELFALQSAVGMATNVIAAGLGGVVARAISDGLGFVPDSPDTYRIILVFMAALLAAGLLVMLRLSDDRPSVLRRRQLLAVGEPAAFPSLRRRGMSLSRLGLTIRDRRTFFRLLLPGLLIPIGAGQIIPFLNLFVQVKFGLDLASLNGVFAVTSLGTMLAVLYQPTLARRFGRVNSVVLVQGVSIPFLIVLGFSPVLWTVIAAMAVRNSLMNAGNPIFTAFAMDRVSQPERATLAAAMSLMWSIGWVISGAYYSIVHATLGFDAGYTVNFITIIVLYSVATWLYWYWFHDAERLAG
ncbi:MAG TPA: MFS transporter [Candidatus Limnocylindrales bacterium]|nr:MFS transporter [Candidatus Limnocylindrales bacterium]